MTTYLLHLADGTTIEEPGLTPTDALSRYDHTRLVRRVEFLPGRITVPHVAFGDLDSLAV